MQAPIDSTPLPDDLASALAACFRLAARRGRAIREAHEQGEKSAEHSETARTSETTERKESGHADK